MSDDLFTGINKPKDLENMSDLEKKHYPTVEAPESASPRESFKVTVTVGKDLPHPDKGDHFIQWVDLYVDDAYLSRLDFTPTVSGTPVSVTLKLNYDCTIRAISRCNLHGMWEGSKKIKIG